MASSAAAPAFAVRSKPRLTFWEIWNMSFGFLGIQIGFALQNANVSRIFETLGAKVENIPLLWIAAPVTGLLIQPIVGYLSDRTWNRLGRRRPYFLTGAVLASIALLVMPNSPALWVAAGMLWIMDASINISMEPFRAFVGDNLPSEQRTTGFAMQSFLIGTGAVAASILPWLLTNLIGSIVSGSILWFFRFTIEEVVALVTFIPVIAAMGGNVGLQSSTMVIRGLATGRIELSDVKRVFAREVLIGFIIGLLCGAVTLSVAAVMHINLHLGMVVGIAMVCALVMSTSMATIMPVVLKRYGVDPAVAAGPFVTTANDITGITIYLSLATTFLSYLK